MAHSLTPATLPIIRRRKVEANTEDHLQGRGQKRPRQKSRRRHAHRLRKREPTHPNSEREGPGGGPRPRELNCSANKEEQKEGRAHTENEKVQRDRLSLPLRLKVCLSTKRRKYLIEQIAALLQYRQERGANRRKQTKPSPGKGGKRWQGSAPRTSLTP